MMDFFFQVMIESRVLFYLVLMNGSGMKSLDCCEFFQDDLITCRGDRKLMMVAK